MMNPEYTRFLAFSEQVRLDLFLGTAIRLGTSVQNVEKDFWELDFGCARTACATPICCTSAKRVFAFRKMILPR